MKRVCRKNGKIIISVYNDKAFSDRLKSYEKAQMPIRKIEGSNVYMGDILSEQFTKQQLKELSDRLKLRSKILELNPISFLCELQK